MINCPNCGRELRPDSSNPLRMKCTYCSYVLDASSGMQGQGSSFQTGQAPIGQQVGQPAAQQYAGQQAYYAPPQGAPVQGMPAPMMPNQPVAPLPKGMAIAALVLGIIAIMISIVPFVNLLSILLGILALIFGIIALVRVGKGIGAGKGMAIAGIICSGFAIMLSIVISVFMFIVLNTVVEYDELPDSIASIIDEIDDDLSDSGISIKHGNHLNGHHSGSASTVDFNDNAAWTSLEFSLDGKDFALLKTRFEDFENESAWRIDLAQAGYPNGYIVLSGEQIESIPLSHEGIQNVDVYVNVYNPSKDQQDLERCILSGVYVCDLDMNVNFKVKGNVGIGDTLDSAVANYGEPFSEYGSSTGSYRSMTYTTSDFNNDLYLVAGGGGRIDEVELIASCN